MLKFAKELKCMIIKQSFHYGLNPKIVHHYPSFPMLLSYQLEK